MEKYILRTCYWLGMVCTVVAVVIRGLDAAGLTKANSMVHEGWNMLFFKGAVLLFLAAIATYAYAAAPQK